MGQKINPLIFRQAIFTPEITSWFSQKHLFPHLNSQDLEVRNFLSSLLKTKGIVLRSCLISRSSNELLVDLDLYFSLLLSRQSKSFWASNFFKNVKKRYNHLNRLKDLRIFLDTFDCEKNGLPNLLSTKKRILFLKKTLDKNRLLSSSKYELAYKHRLSFFLLRKEQNQISVKKKKNSPILGSVKKGSSQKFIRLKLSKLKKLFFIKKFNLSFPKFFLKKFLRKRKNFNWTLIELNKALCKSLQNFTGLEKIRVKLTSNQLNFLPTFKAHYSFFCKELFRFQRSRNFGKFFPETLETLYFVLGNYSYGNANLLAKLIVFFLENNRSHTAIVVFLKKALDVFFKKLPGSFLAVNGIKILIKGRFNKRRRTKTVIIQEGQIALQTLNIPLDYCQTYAVTLYGSFGVKVWLSKKIKKL